MQGVGRWVMRAGLGVLALVLLLSLGSFHPLDPHLFTQGSAIAPVQNLCGTVGANLAGLLQTLLGIGGWLVPPYLLWEAWPSKAKRRWTERLAWLGLALATWTALGGTTLARTGTQMADLLEAGNIDGARALLPSLCGRDPAVLDSAGLVRAACESIAENTSDAQVAPLFWAAVAGMPGVLGYRAVNTLDAMIGNRSQRYARFGWAAARLDDVVNYIPARLTGVLVLVCAPLGGGSPVGAARAWRRAAHRHDISQLAVVELEARRWALGGREHEPLLGAYDARVCVCVRAHGVAHM